jgi:hypothetical protein
MHVFLAFIGELLRVDVAGVSDLPSAIATAGLAWDYSFYLH